MTDSCCWINLTRPHDNLTWNQCCCICKNQSKTSEGTFKCEITFGDDETIIFEDKREHWLCEMFEERKVDKND